MPRSFALKDTDIRELIQMEQAGASDAMIALRFGVTTRTVENYRRRIKIAAVSPTTGNTAAAQSTGQNPEASDTSIDVSESQFATGQTEEV